MMDTILTRVSSGSTSPGSMLTRASCSISPTGVSEHGVEDCMEPAAGEVPECLLRLKEGLLWALESSRSITLIGVGIWLPKDASTRNLVRGEESLDPVEHGNVG